MSTGTSLPGRTPRSRTARPLFALVAVALLLGACSVVKGTVVTIKDLNDAGFTSADIQVLEADAYQVTVRKDAEDLDAAAIEAAGIVWRKLPLRIERLEVTCGNGFGGKGVFTGDRTELELRFGARNPELDRGIRKDDVRTAGLVIVGLLVLGVLVLVGILVLVLFLIRRNKRRNPPPGPPGWGPLPPPPGYRPPA